MIDRSGCEDGSNGSAASRTRGFHAIQDSSPTPIMQAGCDYSGAVAVSHQANRGSRWQAIDQMCQINSVVIGSKTIVHHTHTWQQSIHIVTRPDEEDHVQRITSIGISQPAVGKSGFVESVIDVHKTSMHEHAGWSSRVERSLHFKH